MLPDPNTFFATGCKCGSCQRSDADFHRLISDMHTVSLVAQAERSEFALKAENYQESGSLPFDPEELSLAAVLSAAVFKLGDEFRKEIDDVIFRYGFDQQRLLDVVERWQVPFSKAFDEIEPEARRIAGSALAVGEAQVISGSLEYVTSKQDILDGIIRSTKYYTNNYFNTFVVPSVQQQISTFLSNPFDPLAEPDLTPLRQALDARLKSVPYWRVVANAAVSRGYHYGYLKAGQVNGYKGYRLVAVLDSRTSDVCLELNGREFYIAQTVEDLERTYRDDNPEAVKNAYPWLKVDDVKDLKGNDLRDKGVIVPPFHGNCRTTIALIT